MWAVHGSLERGTGGDKLVPLVANALETKGDDGDGDAHMASVVHIEGDVHGAHV